VLALPHSRHFAALRRSRRDFKEHAFPMAEERWSVASGHDHLTLCERDLQAPKIK
jgi:hypothetical protein